MQYLLPLYILAATICTIHAAPVDVSEPEKREVTASQAASSAYASLQWSSVKDSNFGSASNFHTYSKDSNPIRGVNLGGWLLLEPWINTDLFSTANFGSNSIPADEFNFVNTLGYAKAGNLLEAHYASWITQSDFATMKSYGLNAVRIPIGYWAWKLMSTDKFYQGSQVTYLEKAISWAKAEGMYVWIDVHGSPGSQNGYDSSGHKNFHDWNGYDNIDQTKEVLNYVFAKYGGETYADTVIGIELVNEPLVGGTGGVTQDFLSGFYSDVISSVRNTIGSHQNIILQDGYVSQGAWAGKSYNSDSKIMYDTHLYMLYNDYLKNLNFEEKISQVCSWGTQIAALSYKEMVGEFTAAFDADSNSVYTKTINNWSASDKSTISRFVQAEFNAFEKGYGWFFWNWKMGNSDQWDFQKLVQNGVIPNPVSKRTYSDCK
ncbi:hypothetical protein DASC09_000600 [Saccharomycopsis crataegensis]|uniref:glucan 1,3-beta-glucosidase n=1 Tax=Saccharomycopsis crataegensis TaxID=43959 RepID=A0AAV5QE68_9ASCO|nr:hypothetical protein DASC09_000600 [Saccharomycopsis crataegensis]